MDLVKSADVSPQLAAKYEREAGRFWHLFYLRNQDRFFKDRHYFEAEFPQLLAARCVLEVGKQRRSGQGIPAQASVHAMHPQADASGI
jgi:hypothetical protein